jgi:hypothetical protein
MAANKYPAKPSSKSAKATSGVNPDFEQATSNRRVADVESARTIYNRFVSDNALRSETIANTRNQLEGGRPYDPRVKEANGTAWECNVNFGDAQSARDRTLLPYWKMVNDVPHKAAFTIDSNAPQSEKWQAAYAEAFDEFLSDWGADYDIQFRNFASNFVNYGPGIVQWGDEEGARYHAVNVQRIYFPKNCRMSPDEWEVVALVRDMSAAELFSKVRDKKTTERSELAGWNREAIEQAIVECSSGGPSPNYRDYTVLSDQLVNNDIAVTTPFQPLTCVWLYVKQFPKDGEKTGKIGCYVFTQQGGVSDFLYSDDDCADSFRHLLGAVWYDTGVDGMVHSIKGFGIKNFFFSALTNRMKSRIVDSATVSMGINFQYTDANNPDETPPVENYGPFTIFPTGLTQLAVYPQLQVASRVLETLQQNQAENNSQYRQNQQQIENSDTATQANILATMQGQISEASASVFLAQYGENILTEQVRRLRIRGSKDEDAKEFVRRLKERGVPDEVIFDKKIRVRTGANAGMANPALRAQMFQEGLALSKMPGVNGRWFLENLIANKYGSNAVDKAMLPEGEESEPVQRRQAIMENVDFGQGIMLPVAPMDAHFEHLQEHLKPLAGIVGAFKQQGQVTPEQASALVITLEHAGQHMAYLEKDETSKAEFQQIAPQFRLIQSIARGIVTRMQSQTQGPQPLAAMPG